MNWINYVISPVAGAVIGYFTNWLAIKMIFLPYREKYILGHRVPFTPGLIPKERGRLAYKIGQVAGDYILTSETLENYMSSEDNKKKICDFFTSYIDNIITKDLSFDDVLQLLLKENDNIVIDELKNMLNTNINEFINDEAVKNNIIEFISTRLIYILKNSNSIIKDKNVIDNIQKILTEKGTEFIFSDEFKNIINSKFKDKKVCDFISEKNILKLKESVHSKVPYVAEYIINFINENEDIDNKLRSLTNKVIEENVGKIAGLFINGDKVYESIKSGLIKYLSSEENQLIITVKIFDFIDKTSQNQVSEVIEKIPLDIRDIIYKNINKETISNIINNFFEYIKDKLNNNNSSLYDFIVNIVPDFESNLKQYIENIWTKFAREEIKNHISKFIDNIVDKIINFKINYFLNKIYKSENINDKIILILNTLINKGAIAISNNIDISKIVEDKINSFEIEVAEEIIISVIKKELNVITYVGGVLGFIIGFVPVIVQLIS